MRLSLILSAIFVLSCLSTYYLLSNSHQDLLNPAGQSPLGGATATPTPDPLRPITLLILGYAGANHDGGYLTDTVILAHLNPRTLQLHLISLPRDLWITLPLSPQGYPAKINHAYAIGRDDQKYPAKPEAFTGQSGGLSLAKVVVSQVTGLPVDYALAVNFDGFRRIINLLGGLAIDVPYAFTDPWYPVAGHEQDTCGFTPEDVATLSAALKGEALEHQFPCRFETLHFDAGRQTLDADQALKFVRSRHALNGGGDFGRGLRQQALLKSLQASLIRPANLGKLPQLFTTVIQHLQTDIPLLALPDLLALPFKPQDLNVASLTLDQANLFRQTVSQDGQYILVPANDSGFTAIQAYLKTALTANPSPIKKN
ncbi:hypothetical protein A2W24_05055 [Microgenomates group bacterium RBG_16_45_19]|nr:MAG: hypothetical protein A2W24_05055 [Microgenomates group bacterium RBG_16_45_19]